MVGRVVGLAFVAGAVWLLLKRGNASKNNEEGHTQRDSHNLPPSIQEMDTEKVHEVPTYGAMSEMSGEGTFELHGSLVAAELDVNGKPSRRAVVDHPKCHSIGPIT